MAKAVRRWCGTKPVKCDLCNRRFNSTEDKHFYDFRNTINGSWGLGCKKCFQRYGVGLGIGRGQKYNLLTMEKEE